MDLCYWGFIKKEVFINWLKSFDIDFKYLNGKRCPIGNFVEYSILNFEFDLDIKFRVSEKNNITRIFLGTWENGFQYQSKYILIEKESKEKTKISTKINSENFKYIKDISEEEVVNALDIFMSQINPERAKSYLRTKKIKSILDS